MIVQYLTGRYDSSEMLPITAADKLGKIPVIGTATGAIRVVWGVVKAAFSALAALGSLAFTNSTQRWSAELRDGCKHVGRGVVEMFSILGTGYLLNEHDKDTLIIVRR